MIGPLELPGSQGLFYSPKTGKKSSSCSVSVNLPQFPLQPAAPIPWVKVLSKFADIFNRRNDMIIKFFVLGISLIYAVLLMIYYNV
jgi:hypothetical protein